MKIKNINIIVLFFILQKNLPKGDNNLNAIDQALLRNERFGIHIEIAPPTDYEIALFFNKYCNNSPINIELIIQESKGLSCVALMSKFSELHKTIQ